MKFWTNILQLLNDGQPVIFLSVVESLGSSPGRQGFKMMVGKNGNIYGSIGGGIMEHKMVELARTLLKGGRFTPFLKAQIHQADIGENRSGMICSGEQKIAFHWLDQLEHLELKTIVDSLNNGKEIILELTSQSFSIVNAGALPSQFEFRYDNEQQWVYRENLSFKNKIYIIGGGHVGLALSQTMHQLGFYVSIFDDRQALNTLQHNSYAHNKQIIDYREIDQYVPEGDNVFVVLVSFGYRTDALCIRKLLDKKVKYFGVMGSKAKMNQLLAELQEEGYTEEQLERLYTPIGLPINSKTPAEIAVSIAAEIVRVKGEEGT